MTRKQHNPHQENTQDNPEDPNAGFIPNETALEFLARSGAGASDLGIDRRGSSVLEVAVVWKDTVTQVQHFEVGDTVTVGDELTRPAFTADTVIDSLASAGAGLIEWWSTVEPVADLFVDSDQLPGATTHELLRFEDGWQLRLGRGFEGWLEDAQGERSELALLAESARATQRGPVSQIALEPGERAVVGIGGLQFHVQEVHRAKVLTAPVTQGVDALYVGVLGLLLVGAAVMSLFIAQTEYEAPLMLRPHEIETAFQITIPEKQRVNKVKQRMTREDAGKGRKAKAKEGQAGSKKRPARRHRGNPAAIDQRKHDKDVALSTGLVADLQSLDNHILFGPSGFDQRTNAAMGDLLASYTGPGGGSNGLSSRGFDTGGGGDAEGVRFGDGDGTGYGHDGGGKDFGYVGEHGDGGEPGVSTGDFIKIGSMDKSVIDRVVKQHLMEFKHCYNRELNKNPKLNGKVSVRFTIGADGKVSSAAVNATSLNNRVVEGCVVAKFLQLRFPKPKGGGLVVVKYPFMFNSAG